MLLFVIKKKKRRKLYTVEHDVQSTCAILLKGFRIISPYNNCIILKLN